MKRRSLLLTAAVAALSACGEKGMSYGDPNSIIAVMSPELWEQVSDEFYEALEPTIQTVRDEKTFTVTYQEPGGPYWDRLRRFRQMVAVGTPSDFWVAEALEEAREEAGEGGGLMQVHDVWARDQTVTLLVLPEGGGEEELVEQLPDIRDTLDRQYRDYARVRMYMSGVDTALADTLRRDAGFTLLLPDVYRRRHTDSVYVFRNDNPDPSELIREIAITWRTPDRVAMNQEGLLAWREQLVAQHYNEPQDVVLDQAVAGPFTFDGREGFELRAVWTNPPDRGWPAAGPFITRLIPCPDQDRVYLIDAWLYAPGKEKYEYMIQIETILETFECGF